MAENLDKAGQNERVTAGEWRQRPRAANEEELTARDVTTPGGHWSGLGGKVGSHRSGLGRKKVCAVQNLEAKTGGGRGASSCRAQGGPRQIKRLNGERRARGRYRPSPLCSQVLFSFLFPEKKAGVRARPRREP